MNETEAVIHIIIPPEQAPAILQQVEDIYLRDCVCRVREQNCPKDMWEVCLLFEHAPQNDLDESKKIPIAEAEELLKITSQRNAIFTLFFTEKKHQITELSSCCTCCCSPLNSKLKERRKIF